MANVNRLPIDILRRPNESTAEFLGRVLDSIELKNMADSARAFHYDDYFCPDTIDDGMSINRLIRDLRYNQIGTSTMRTKEIQFIIDAAQDGVFDGTKEESEKYATSPKGQLAYLNFIGWENHGQ
jgi:hypothetical protein